MTHRTCVMCGGTGRGSLLVAEEMMLGTHDEFTYWECPDCGTLELCDVPVDLSRYYPTEDYYSLQADAKGNGNFLVRLAADFVLRTKLPLPLYDWLRLPRSARWFRGLGIRRSSSILDVGSGRGAVLHGLASVGFSCLQGVDPFVPRSLEYPNGVTITKGSIADVTGQFDVVMFHHSFEHMANPREVLEAAVARLGPGGWLLVRIPVADSWAFRMYREKWVQIDAPRHQFIYTTQSFQLLAESVGLTVVDMFRDSHAVGLYGSEQYRRNIPLHVMGVFSSDEVKAFRKLALRLNSQGLGDQAAFLMKRDGD